MSASKFQRQVREILDDLLPQEWAADGWPNSEMNLCHLAGMKGARFADYYVHSEDGRAFVVEVHSELHNDKGIGAWGGTIDDHYRRQGNDENKRHVCARLGIELIELWPKMSIEEITENVLNAVDCSCYPDIKEDTERVTGNASFGKSTGGWKSRPMSTQSKPFEQGRKMESKSSFAKGAGSFGKRD
jgi:hypothetical protein